MNNPNAFDLNGVDLTKIQLSVSYHAKREMMGSEFGNGQDKLAYSLPKDTFNEKEKAFLKLSMNGGFQEAGDKVFIYPQDIQNSENSTSHEIRKAGKSVVLGGVFLGGAMGLGGVAAVAGGIVAAPALMPIIAAGIAMQVSSVGVGNVMMNFSDKVSSSWEKLKGVFGTREDQADRTAIYDHLDNAYKVASAIEYDVAKENEIKDAIEMNSIAANNKIQLRDIDKNKGHYIGKVVAENHSTILMVADPRNNAGVIINRNDLRDITMPKLGEMANIKFNNGNVKSVQKIENDRSLTR